MSEILQSPFTVLVCFTVLLAWVLLVLAIFWPRPGERKNPPRKKDERHVRF